MSIESSEVQIPAKAEIWFEISGPCASLARLTVHCRLEDETAKERRGHPPSHAEAKKMKSLTLNTTWQPQG